MDSLEKRRPKINLRLKIMTCALVFSTLCFVVRYVGSVLEVIAFSFHLQCYLSRCWTCGWIPWKNHLHPDLLQCVVLFPVFWLASNSNFRYSWRHNDHSRNRYDKHCTSWSVLVPSSSSGVDNEYASPGPCMTELQNQECWSRLRLVGIPHSILFLRGKILSWDTDIIIPHLPLALALQLWLTYHPRRTAWTSCYLDLI
jgi:hypothetical protein